jgi:hypothetical protein
LVYRGLWAEPDVAAAAVMLKALADDPAVRRSLGERARNSALTQLDGRHMVAALKALG